MHGKLELFLSMQEELLETVRSATRKSTLSDWPGELYIPESEVMECVISRTGLDLRRRSQPITLRPYRTLTRPAMTLSSIVFEPLSKPQLHPPHPGAPQQSDNVPV
jgi:hypothetical protein